MAAHRRARRGRQPLRPGHSRAQARSGIRRQGPRPNHQLLGMSSMNTRKDLASELAALQDRVGNTPGPRYWRSLEELADTEAFRELMQREFPEQASVWPNSLNRRQFLTLMGASLMLAGLGGCSVRPAPSTTIHPYVRAPTQLLPLT